MSFLTQFTDPATGNTRRSFMSKSGLLLSGAAVALLAGQDALAAKGNDATTADVSCEP